MGIRPGLVAQLGEVDPNHLKLIGFELGSNRVCLTSVDAPMTVSYWCVPIVYEQVG